MLWAWGMQRLSEPQIREFFARFEALLKEFDLAEPAPKTDESQDFRLFMTLFPVKAFLQRGKAAE